MRVKNVKNGFWKFFLAGAFCCWFVLNAAACLDGPWTSTPAINTPTAEDWYSLYFTDPTAPSASSYRGGADEALAEAFNQARVSIDLAIYELGSARLRDAIIDAHQRGVQVRVVTESNNLDYDEMQAIIEAGIPVLGDRREGLMHNKFIIIDRQDVWTGSMNLTNTDSYRNDNNLIRIHSTQLAEDYLREFEEMFNDDLFGAEIRADTPYPQLTVNDTTIEVSFSPDDGTARKLVDLIASAQESVSFMAFSFTADDLADALLDRAQAGVVVEGVMDKSQVNSNTGTDYDRFLQAGLDVRLDGNPYKMHNKVLIIDGKIVVTGSYNFSKSAEQRNDENTLIIYNEDIARQYEQEFLRIYNLAGR